MCPGSPSQSRIDSARSHDKFVDTFLVIHSETIKYIQRFRDSELESACGACDEHLCGDEGKSSACDEHAGHMQLDQKARAAFVFNLWANDQSSQISVIGSATSTLPNDWLGAGLGTQVTGRTPRVQPPQCWRTPHIISMSDSRPDAARMITVCKSLARIP